MLVFSNLTLVAHKPDALNILGEKHFQNVTIGRTGEGEKRGRERERELGKEEKAVRVDAHPRC